MCSPPLAGANTRSSPPALFRAFLHCYYKNVYGIRPVTRELQNTVVWLSCGFDRPPSRDAVDRFLTDLEHVVDEVFDRLSAGRLPRPAAACSTTHHRFHRREDDARRPRRVERLTIQPPKSTTTATAVRSSRPGKDPDCRGSSPRAKQAPEETAMRVTCDALAVEKPI